MPIQSLFMRDRLPAKRDGREADAELIARRATLTELSGPADADGYETIAGIRCAVSSHPQPRAIIVHCHGGGYRHGTARGWAAFGGRLAAATASRVILPDYSLAPEHPFPAAIHEIVDVIEQVADTNEAGLPLLISGDSAGGGLATAVASLLARPAPVAAIVLLSPWLDLRLTADSFTRCAVTDPIFSHDAAVEAVEGYMQGLAADHPLASPLLADLGGLPPVQIHASTGEVLVDDSLLLIQRLAEEGVRADLHVEVGPPHVWPVCFPEMPESERSMRLIGRFVDEVTSSR